MFIINSKIFVHNNIILGSYYNYIIVLNWWFHNNDGLFIFDADYYGLVNLYNMWF